MKKGPSYLYLYPFWFMSQIDSVIVESSVLRDVILLFQWDSHIFIKWTKIKTCVLLARRKIFHQFEKVPCKFSKTENSKYAW